MWYSLTSHVLRHGSFCIIPIERDSMETRKQPSQRVIGDAARALADNNSSALEKELGGSLTSIATPHFEGMTRGSNGVIGISYEALHSLSPEELVRGIDVLSR
jgi:hypothetical protein